MNTANRGSKQDESLVIRVTSEDKAMLKVAAQERGTSMSTVVKNALMKDNIIKPIYPSF
jgi:uncharacterized protein (DUF1778 family)